MANPKRKRRIVTLSDRWQALIEGEITMDDLDDEEIMRMQLRASDGSFKGRPPQHVPREVAQKFRNEQIVRWEGWVKEHVADAQKAVLELVNSPRLQPGDATRLKAAELILERFVGKVSDKVQVTVEEKKPYELALDDAVVYDIEEDDDEFHLGELKQIED